MRIDRSSRLGRFLARFVRAERGVTAIEFALVSLPLLALIFGTLEVACIVLVVTSLDTATETAGRMIRTGEFQTSAANTRADFKGLVCARMGWLANQCNANLTVSVQVFNTFQALAASPPVAPANFLAPPAPPPATCFATGQPKDIVLVRTYYRWPLFVPVLSLMDNTGRGARVVTFATAFRNEPYNENPPGGAAC